EGVHVDVVLFAQRDEAVEIVPSFGDPLRMIASKLARGKLLVVGGEGVRADGLDVPGQVKGEARGFIDAAQGLNLDLGYEDPLIQREETADV
ncbi:MAG: hypothetical protein E6614_31425, partial [Bradyrhizobium sp.]|nr:hypothetical protein [Bradyrhizobium sp.]